MSDHLPVTLANLHEDAKRAGDRLTTFRSYVKLLNSAYKALEKAREETRLAERHLNSLKVDHSFFVRHKARVETVFKALRETYRNPAKALRTVDELAAHYPAQYVFEVCQLGTYRLGVPLGWSFFGVHSATRTDADRNYAEVAIPALAQMLPDHAGYLALRSKDVEQDYDDALASFTRKRSTQAAIETTVPGWSQELLALSLAMTPAEIEKLSNSEREVRRRLMPIPKTSDEEV